jgi:hypothetical protein
MTSVSVSEINNTIVVTEQTGTTTTVIVPSESVIINAIGVGPQGPAGPPGPGGIVVDETNRVNRSIVYFDANTTTYKADAVITDLTLTDGGNF